MLELGTPFFQEQIKLGPRPYRGIKRRNSPFPLEWNIRLTRDVLVDARAGLRAYCLGTTGTSPTVQVLVRGHYRRQPCGAGGLERRIIQIEPYWRGPEDGPIGVRSHVLGEP